MPKLNELRRNFGSFICPKGQNLYVFSSEIFSIEKIIIKNQYFDTDSWQLINVRFPIQIRHKSGFVVMKNKGIFIKNYDNEMLEN